MNAAMPPIAKAPRRWQVGHQQLGVGAHHRRRHGDRARSGSTNAGPASRKYLITLNR